MIKKLKALTLIGLLCGTISAHAVLLDNGSTTIDTATGLAWLDLTLTEGQSYNSIASGFGGYVALGYRLQCL